MGSDHYLNLQPGTVVNGRYEVIKCLGTGSMGMVYACRHKELAGHVVAMKVLFAEVARDEVAAARFRNEIVASYGVSHPNVVRAYEYFRDGDLIAFTMEFIGGGDLADRINSDEILTIEEIVSMLCQMASGVQAIHDAGIIHRDLKPENILISPQGNVKITDFGIARCGTGPKLTEHGGVVGTIDYVSPEYLERGQVDARSDIYALGVLAYEMVTGEAPYKGKSVIETMTMRLRSDPDAPHHLRPECPVGLSNIILKAMRRDPEKRYQSAKDILRDLNALKTNGEVSIRETGKEAGSKRPNTRSLAEKIDEFASSSVMPIASEPHSAPVSSMNMSQSGYGSAALGGSGLGGGGLSAVVGTVKEGTLELEARSANQFRETVAEELHDYDTIFPDSVIDDVLEAKSFPDRRGILSPGVAISRSRLSTDRMRELSDGVYQDGPGIGGMIFKLFLMLLMGLGVGFLLMFLGKQWLPQVLGSDTQVEESL